MAYTRYDEYVYGGMPFMLYSGLYRSETERSPAANWHEDLEAQLCLSGRGRIMTDGVYHDFAPGDIFVIGPDTIHITVTDSELVYSAFIFDTAFCRRAGYLPWPFGSCFRARGGGFADLLGEMERCFTDGTVPYRTARLQEMTLRLLTGLCSLAAGEIGRTDPVSPPERCTEVMEAIRLIRENCRERLTLDGIAKAVYADKYTLSRKFRRYTGRTIFTYINDYRCQIAAENLKSGMPVSEAALSCGFSNMSFFTRTFRARFGCPPSEYRRSSPASGRAVTKSD